MVCCHYVSGLYPCQPKPGKFSHSKIYLVCQSLDNELLFFVSPDNRETRLKSNCQFNQPMRHWEFYKSHSCTWDTVLLKISTDPCLNLTDVRETVECLHHWFFFFFKYIRWDWLFSISAAFFFFFLCIWKKESRVFIILGEKRYALVIIHNFAKLGTYLTLGSLLRRVKILTDSII